MVEVILKKGYSSKDESRKVSSSKLKKGMCFRRDLDEKRILNTDLLIVVIF
jgi:hypothetical protein